MVCPRPIEFRVSSLRSRFFALGMAVVLSSVSVLAAEKTPVFVGLDGEFGLQNSISAQAIELGLRTAITEINESGGVLGGRPIELVTKENRSILARSVKNNAEFAAMPDLVAVFGGRFSPMIAAQVPALNAAELPYLAVWSADDSIIDNGAQPNYLFRLSLRDSLAMPKLLQSAEQRGFDKVGLMLVNSSRGTRSLAEAERYLRGVKNQEIVGVTWFSQSDTTLIMHFKRLMDAGAQAVVFVGADLEGSVLVRELAALPPDQRVPVLSHWGVTGGDFFQQAGGALAKVDFSVIQTFSFFNADKTMLARFMKTATRTGGIKRIKDIRAPVGVAHAYDMMHILAKAINLAGSTGRSAVRDALERVREHRGLIKLYKPPFTAARHEALGPAELLMARYNREGVLLPVQK